MSGRDKLKKIGTSVGLARPRPAFAVRDKHVRVDPEQVYVFVDTDAVPWIDVDGRKRPARSIVLEGWVGWATPVAMNLTKGQARKLAQLLIEALSPDDEEDQS